MFIHSVSNDTPELIAREEIRYYVDKMERWQSNLSYIVILRRFTMIFYIIHFIGMIAIIILCTYFINKGEYKNDKDLW